MFYRLCCQHKVEPRDFLTGCPFKTTHTHTKKNFRRDRGGTAGKVVVFTLSLHQGHCGHARFLSTGTPYCLICAFVYLFVLLFFFFFLVLTGTVVNSYCLSYTHFTRSMVSVVFSTVSSDLLCWYTFQHHLTELVIVIVIVAIIIIIFFPYFICL